MDILNDPEEMRRVLRSSYHVACDRCGAIMLIAEIAAHDVVHADDIHAFCPSCTGSIIRDPRAA